MHANTVSLYFSTCAHKGLGNTAWQNRMAGPIEPEPHMPDRDEIHPFVHILTRRTWPDVAEYLQQARE